MERKVLQKTVLATLISLALSACGGGSSGSSNSGDNQSTSATKINMQIIDGYLVGVTVCADLNNNIQCDTEEPSAKTDEKGKASVEVKNLESYSPFKLLATIPEGTEDVVFGKSNKTKKPFVLTRTVFPSEIVKNQSEEEQPSILVNPFTTLVDLTVPTSELKNLNSQDYKEQTKKIAKSLGIAEDIIDIDYNDPSLKNSEEHTKVEIAAEFITNLGLLPESLEDASQKIENDIQTLDSVKENLEQYSEDIATIHEQVSNLKEDEDVDIGGLIADNVYITVNEKYSYLTHTASVSAQVIDGYLEAANVCLDLNQNLVCDDDEPLGIADSKGKVRFFVDTQVLEDNKVIKFISYHKKGQSNNILGKSNQTKNDIVLTGSLFTNGGGAPKETVKITPFTTIVDSSFGQDKHISEDLYISEMSKLAEKFNTSYEAIASDYNNSSDDLNIDQVGALFAGEMLVRSNFIPISMDDLKNKNKVNQPIEELNDRVDDIANISKEIVDSIDLSSDLADDFNNKLKEVDTKLGTSFKSLSSGLADEWRCGVTRTNNVYCWGNNSWDSLGNPYLPEPRDHDGSIPDDGYKGVDNYSAKPVVVMVKDGDGYKPLNGVSKVVAGNIHACAITLDGEVYCWGGNHHGQLGIGSIDIQHATIPYAQKVLSGMQDSHTGYLSGIVDLTAGQNHVCALDKEGDVYCWGDNSSMELGGRYPDYEERSPYPEILSQNGDSMLDFIKLVTKPVKVEFPNTVKKVTYISEGYWAHCAIVENVDPDDNQNLYCWGNDIVGTVSGDFSIHFDEIKAKWLGTKTQGNEKVELEKPWGWHVYETGGEWYPMVGMPVTKINTPIKKPSPLASIKVILEDGTKIPSDEYNSNLIKCIQTGTKPEGNWWNLNDRSVSYYCLGGGFDEFWTIWNQREGAAKTSTSKITYENYATNEYTYEIKFDDNQITSEIVAKAKPLSKEYISQNYPNDAYYIECTMKPDGWNDDCHGPLNYGVAGVYNYIEKCNNKGCDLDVTENGRRYIISYQKDEKNGKVTSVGLYNFDANKFISFENNPTIYGTWNKDFYHQVTMSNGEDRVKRIYPGPEAYASFILTEGGNVFAWGNGKYGLLGQNNTDKNTDGVYVLNSAGNDKLSNVVELSVNKRSVCASVSKDSSELTDKAKYDLYCWGSSTFGQMGFDNGDGGFSYYDTSVLWDGSTSNNEIFDKETRFEKLPKLIDTIFDKE